MDHAAAGVADQERKQEGDHRANELGQFLIGSKARRNEEGRDDAPGDESADVGHDHSGQERPEFLDANPQAGAGFCNCLCCHVIS
ncbi:hypothetical protein D9M72_339180 [compost metagenome]